MYRAESSSFDPGGGQCALRTNEAADRHTVHCCSHYHVTTTMTYFEHLLAPIFGALPRPTTSPHLPHLPHHHITTSTTSTPTTLRLQHLDDDSSPPLRIATTAGYHYHYNYTTPTTTYYHFNYY